MYRKKHFSIRPVEETLEDIKEASKVIPWTRRVFLADGDAFILKTDFLINILEHLNKAFPSLQRAGIYANPHGILHKSKEELEELKKLKLSISYLGLESGSENILKSVNKGFTAEEMIDCVRLAQDCGIKMSVIILLGLGGDRLSEEHALKTAEVLNRMNPKYLSALTLMPVPGTPLYEAYKKGHFILKEAEDMLKELRLIIENLKLEGTIFRSDHASNYLPLKGRFPKDKERLLSDIDYTLKHIDDDFSTLPDFLRGL
jgi:radical SAM superfamily enzyme YgiQ (UPF0313 family)